MISINDVARKVGVAKSTVSNALTGKKYVSPELKEKVLKACKELDYTPKLQLLKRNILYYYLQTMITKF